MKTVIAIVVAALLVGGHLGCGKKEEGAKEEKGPLDSTIDYVTGNTAIKEKSRAHRTTFRASVSNAISLFEVEEGRSPTSLKELVDAGYLDRRVLNDEYGRPVEEEVQGNKLIVRSVRIDKESGERIVNWQETF